MNNTKDVNDRDEYARVFDTVSKEAFDEAREMLESNPRQFYNQLVVLLWNTEDWEDCGADYEDDSIQRDIFDTIQGIAARDTKIRKFMKLCEQIQSKHPDWLKTKVLSTASKQMED